ncbi:PspC domain-containing protein [Nesterenkonia xinjiangensis]|uniref:Phage shock protein PspC (Stress-responsive transcriptional regulator)/uncharacterized membrane protein n=1 Tax=Nesterenkonia xinjiangensis TaxID=225327 RepID=A0A7Z0GLM6_9MICC|nr:PspC domain-containing protein [Nesterenkonia xinjiangensis]NYJ77416.1 phage shock protein PspC (stress-responsive transcriptional regulator)/uncharacterized membrane protein [Nesterenkonia xinjiangensis]
MDDSTTPRDEEARPRPDAPGPRPEAGHQFFDWIRSTGLHRPDTGWIGGVMALLAEKLRWDAALVRGLGVVAVVLFFSPTILLYGLAWILVPDREGRIPVQQALRGDFTAGLFGGATLAVVGALNVFTPLSIAGPFAILVNLLVIGVVVWIVVALVRGHQRGTGDAPGAGGSQRPKDDDARQQHRQAARDARHEARREARQARHDARREARAQHSEREEPAQGKAPAGSSSSVRDDGRPAWYPKESADSESTPPAASPGAQDETDSCRSTAVMPTLAQREEARRRRMVSFGLLLAAASGVLLAVAVLGIPGTSALLVGLVGLVSVLALLHMVAALRGRRGRGFLLTVTTLAMLATFFLHQNPGSAPTLHGSNVAFGQYTSQDESMNSAFANSTMDLRHLTSGEPGQTEVVHAELNSAFARVTVVIPDDAALTVESRQALGRLDIHTQDEQRSARGMDLTEHTVGDADADLQIRLTANTAFNRVTIYDATTYAEESVGAPASEGGDLEGAGQDSVDLAGYPVPGTAPTTLEGSPR